MTDYEFTPIALQREPSHATNGEFEIQKLTDAILYQTIHLVRLIDACASMQTGVDPRLLGNISFIRDMKNQKLLSLTHQKFEKSSNSPDELLACVG